jgi:hypothetical protein
MVKVLFIPELGPKVIRQENISVSSCAKAKGFLSVSTL